MLIWSEESILTLKEMVKYLKSTTIGSMLESFAKFYMNRHLLFMHINNYSMNLLSNENIEIDEGEYKLAFICEIYYFIFVHKNKQTIIYAKDVYFYFQEIIKYVLKDVVELKIHKLSNNEFFLLSMLKDAFFAKQSLIKKINDNNRENVVSKIKYKIDPILETISNSYFITIMLMNICKEHSNDIYKCENIITNTEDLDINFLSKQEINSIKETLQTKRNLYLKILLILINENLKKKYIEAEDIINSIKFKNYKSFIYKIQEPILEAIFFICHKKI